MHNYTNCMHVWCVSYLFCQCRIEKTWRTTCGKADHLWQQMFAIDGRGTTYGGSLTGAWQHTQRNSLLSVFVNGDLWRTVVFVVTTISYQCIWTPEFGESLICERGLKLIGLLYSRDGASFTKDPLGSSNPSFKAFKCLNRAIVQYMFHWHLACTERSVVLIIRMVHNKKKFVCFNFMKVWAIWNILHQNFPDLQ